MSTFLAYLSFGVLLLQCTNGSSQPDQGIEYFLKDSTSFLDHRIFEEIVISKRLAESGQSIGFAITNRDNTLRSSETFTRPSYNLDVTFLIFQFTGIQRQVILWRDNQIDSFYFTFPNDVSIHWISGAKLVVDRQTQIRLIKVIEGFKSFSYFIEIRNSQLQINQLEFEFRFQEDKVINFIFLQCNVHARGIRIINRDITKINENLILVRLLEEIKKEKEQDSSLVYPKKCRITITAMVKRMLELAPISLPSNCSQVSPTTSLCIICDSSYYLDASSNCQPCISPCDNCNGSTATSCLTCVSNYRHTSNNECVACGSNQYLDTTTDTCANCIAHCDACSESVPCITCSSSYSLNPALSACIICNTASNNYIDSSNICQICPTECATCSSATVCHTCQSSFIFYATGQTCVLCDAPSGNYLNTSGICSPCNGSCLTCDINSTHCMSCPVNSELDVSSNSCRSCLLGLGEYYDPADQTCKICNTSCSTCTDYLTCTSCPMMTYVHQDNTCSTCLVSNGYYIDSSSVYCLPCHDSNCLKCVDGSITSCQICKPNMAVNIFTYLCSYCPTTSDPVIFTQDQTSASCKCTVSNNYITQDSNGILSCLTKTNTYISGYFCDSLSKTCQKCTDTECNQCNSSLTCLQCKIGYYLVGTVCLTTCPVGSSLIQTTKMINTVSSVVSSCQCGDKENTVIVYQNAQFQCILKLSISSLKAEVNTNNNMNSVILCLNRVPFAEEYAGITIELKTSTGISILSKGSACQYVTATSSGSSQCIARVVSVTLSDKCILLTVETSKIIVITQINVTSDSYLSASLDIPSLVLTTTSYNASHTSDGQLSSSLSSISSALTGNNSMFLLDILKYLQVLCMFSNFIQVVAPLVLLFNSIPVVLKSMTALAASFIFPQVPDFSAQIYTESSSTSRTSDSTMIDTSDVSSKIFQSLGLEHSIYIDYIFLPHLILSITCCILIFCVSFRFLMKGKQYTVEFFTLFLNFQASFIQGSLTFSVLSIAYSFTSSNPNDLIVTCFTLFCHIILQILIIFSFHYFTKKTLETKLPNLHLNLIQSARGSRYYLTFAFLKKYLFLSFIITISPHSPFIAALSCTFLFGIFTIYISYFRFFSTKTLLIFKILQELLATISFCLLTVCIKTSNDIISKGKETDDISIDSLENLSTISFATTIFFSICLLLSFLRFFSSTLLEVNGIVTTCIARFKFQKQQQKQLEIELKQLEVLPSESNYIKAALEIFFKEKAKDIGDSFQDHSSQGSNSLSLMNQVKGNSA